MEDITCHEARVATAVVSSMAGATTSAHLGGIHLRGCGLLQKGVDCGMHCSEMFMLPALFVLVLDKVADSGRTGVVWVKTLDVGGRDPSMAIFISSQVRNVELDSFFHDSSEERT